MRRYARTLVAVALATTVVAGTAGWASGNAQQALTGPPPGTAAWRADHVLGRQLPAPERAAPAEVSRFFRGLTAGQQQALVIRHPLVVGNLDGVPVELRYRANARSLRASHDPRYTHLAEPGHRQILAFDPRGRGQVAEVFGDLSTARHVAVVVPGSDIDAGTFDRTSDVYGTPAGMAKSLYAETGHGSAVVAWAGYTTPVGVGIDAATGSLAEAGVGQADPVRGRAGRRPCARARRVLPQLRLRRVRPRRIPAARHGPGRSRLAGDARRRRRGSAHHRPGLGRQGRHGLDRRRTERRGGGPRPRPRSDRP